MKNLGLDFQVGGEVADGYRFTGVESDVKSISVEGRKATLASLDSRYSAERITESEWCHPRCGGESRPSKIAAGS